MNSQSSKALTLLGCVLMGSIAQASQSPSPRELSGGLLFEEVTRSSDILWGFDFISGEEVLWTERSGKLVRFHLKTKVRQEISGLPKVWAKGQGGLLDIRVDPQDKSRVYFTYSAEVSGKGGATALGTAKIQGSALTEFKQLFVSNTPTSSGQHFGSRIEFDSPNTLIFSIGDRGEREFVQNPKSHNGKVIRLTRDGQIPSDNPFANSPSHAPEVFTLGHRSPQGLAMRSDSLLVLAEMGPRGGDEINILKPRGNYGWPILTFGREYWGPRIGEGSTKAGFESPVHQWTPSISPSGIVWVEDKTLFPSWKGSLLVGCLSGKQMRRIEFQKVGNQWSFLREQSLLADLDARIRNLRMGPDGALYLSTDGGVFGRVSPGKKFQ